MKKHKPTSPERFVADLWEWFAASPTGTFYVVRKQEQLYGPYCHLTDARNKAAQLDTDSIIAVHPYAVTKNAQH